MTKENTAPSTRANNIARIDPRRLPWSLGSGFGGRNRPPRRCSRFCPAGAPTGLLHRLAHHHGQRSAGRPLHSPSTSSPRRPGARRTGAVKGETGSRSGAQPQASTERVRISGQRPALDRRSPAGGHHDDEIRRRAGWRVRPARSGSRPPPPAHYGQIRGPWLSRAKVRMSGRPTRQAQRVAPERRGGVRD